MNIVTQNIAIKKEELTLTNQRAIFWKRENALILSDIHIGKTGHFKKHGIPMPDAILKKDLERLKTLILHFKTEKILIVGDLFHAEYNQDMTTFKTWLQQFEALELVLIKGNHDRLSKRIIDDFNLKLSNKLHLTPFTFVHEPAEETEENTFTISGHTHPGVLIKAKARQRIKLPCYQVGNTELILPAFSLFTGLNTNDAPKDCINYAFTASAIFKL